MVNEDILGGIEEAVENGSTLESAMMSFYNAGYLKEDIEWAAKSYQIQESARSTRWLNPFKGGTSSVSGKGSSSNPSQVLKNPSTKVVQNVSSYEASQFKDKIILIVLISSFVALLGILAGIFLFKEQVVDFFNSLFVG